MFEEDEWRELVEKLLRITAAGNAEWVSESGMFVMNAGGFRYTLGAVDHDDRPPYFLRVRDHTGLNEFAELESRPLSDDPRLRSKSQAVTAAQRIPDLYAAARRAASGGPAMFRELMRALDPLDPLDPQVPPAF